MGSALGLLLSLGSELLGQDPSSPPQFPTNKPSHWDSQGPAGMSQGQAEQPVRWSGLSPDTGCTLRQPVAGSCHAADFASRLLSLIVTGFSSVCLVTS